MIQLKKQWCILILFISINYASNAQNYSSSIEMSSGYVQNGFGIQGSYNYDLNKKEYIKSSLLTYFTKEKYTDISLKTTTITLNVGYYNTVWTNLRQTLKTSLGVGIIGGYESINNDNTELPNGALINSDSRFIYGMFIASEHDIYLSNKYSLIVKFHEYYHINSDVGKFIPFIGIGVRYYIY